MSQLVQAVDDGATEQVNSREPSGGVSPGVRLWRYPFLFLTACLVLFLLSGRSLHIFDEGIALTCAMRIMHGQVPYRDFYYNYGPAQMCINAALFKLFGPSALIWRLTEVAGAAAQVTSVYVIVRSFCSRRIAVAALVLSLVLFGASIMGALELWSAWFLLPIFQQPLARRRSLYAGILLGLLTLYRYDTGIGVAAAQFLSIAIAIGLRERGVRPRLRAFAEFLLPYVAGLALILLPCAILYLSRAPLHDLLYDVVIYNAKYYRIGRGLPFPRVHRQTLEELIVYLVPCLVLLNAISALYLFWKNRSIRLQIPSWLAAVIVFNFITAIMYAKASVRMNAGSMYLCTPPCVIVLAILLQQRARIASVLRTPLMIAAALFCISAGVFKEKLVHADSAGGVLTLRWLVSKHGQVPRPPFDGWCKEENPITRGFCYVIDDDHIQAVHYIVAHTRPNDRLYVGLPRHDRYVINDNLTYFATQRLPAVKWTQFDPFLENRADIQTQMIQELEESKPPYVVLDSEFDGAYEPNGSSISTGVHLLDDYIAAHYTPVQRFGEMTISQRR